MQNCKAFARHFSSVYCSDIKAIESVNLNINRNSYSNTLSEMIFNMTDITRQISKLNSKKSDGPSIIPTVLIKKCCALFSRIFYVLFNAILLYEKIPTWKKVYSVTPVHKPNKTKNSITSYRPVSVSNNCMKIFESLLFNNVNSFITCNNILPDCRYGFRTGISTSHQLIDLIYAITSAFDDRNLICVDAIFLD
jgi:hypothetical protein